VPLARKERLSTLPTFLSSSRRVLVVSHSFFPPLPSSPLLSYPSKKRSVELPPVPFPRKQNHCFFLLSLRSITEYSENKPIAR
jgi:putative SOS response-associated peptidase YedK